MPKRAGQIIWHELFTADRRAALSFYPTVTGWSIGEGALGDDAVFLDAARGPVASIAAPERHRDGEAWVAYVLVDDLDVALGRAESLGAALVQRSDADTGFGRNAILRDPQGAAIGLASSAEAEEDGKGRGEATSGGFGWHELYAEEVEVAFRFYAAMFGWERSQTFDMGPAGPYVVVSSAGSPIGGMMRRPAIIPSCLWSPFAQVMDIGDAEARVVAAGGTIVDGLRPTPGGNWTVKCTDSRGASFALSGRRDR